MSLPVMKIFRESLCHIKEHKLSWLKSGFTPLILLFIGEMCAIITTLMPGIFDFALFDTKLIVPFLFLFSINGIFSVIWGASFYINGYRYAILNEEARRWWHLSFNKRLLKMIGYSLFTGSLVKGSLLGAAFLLYLVSKSLPIFVLLLALFVFLLIYMLIRLSLVFPLIAIDQAKPLRTSWKLLKGNSLRLLTLISLTSLTTMGLVLLIGVCVGLLWFVLTFISPFVAAYVWAFGWLVFGKIIALLMSLTVVGIGLEGISGFCVTLFLGATLGFINPLLLYVFPILIALFILPLVFLTWAVFTKVLSLVYETLTEEKRDRVMLRSKL